MKITETQLRELVRESLSEAMNEYGGGYHPYDNNGNRVSSDYTNRGGWDDDYNDLDAIYRAQNARQQEMGLREETNENQNDEGTLGALKGAWNSAKQVVSGEWNKFKRGVMDKGLNNEYQGQTVGDRLKTAGKHIKTGFKSGDKQQELTKIERALLKLQDTHSFGGETILKTQNQQNALKVLLNAVKMAKQGSVGGVNSAATKRYGTQKPAAQSQEPRQKVALEEDSLEEDWWDQGMSHGYGSNDHMGSHGDEYFYNSGAHRSAWDLNESKLDKAIRESIKKVLENA